MPKWGLTDQQRELRPWGLDPAVLEPAKTITDPVHGDIYLNRLEVMLLDTAPMQRLRRVRQLGTTHLVYPGASHSRLSHVLGAVRAAQDLLDAVVDNRNSPHRKVPDLFDQWDEEERSNPDDASQTRDFRLAEATVLARLGALVHDFCHVPFGHTIEDDLKVLDPHDKNKPRLRYLWGQLSLDVRRTLGSADGQLVPELHALIMSKDETEWRSRYPFVADIVGNTICADLLDYIRRDHLYTGLPMAIGDRFVDDFYVVGSDHVHYPKHMAITVTRSGKRREDIITELLKFLRYRYELSERVLYHHAKVAADAMIGKLLEMWSDAVWADLATKRSPVLVQRAGGTRNTTDLQLAIRRADSKLAREIEQDMKDELENEFRQWSDDGLLEHLQQLAESRPQDDRWSAIADLTGAVLSRQLFKPIGHANGPDAIALAESLYERWGGPQERRDLERDAAEFAGLPHKWHIVLWIPNPAMKLKVAEVLVDDGGQIMPLSRFTSDGDGIVEAHKRLWAVEVYVHPGVRDDQPMTDSLLAFLGQRLGVAFKRTDGSEVPDPFTLAIGAISDERRLNQNERTQLLDLVPAAKGDGGTYRSLVTKLRRTAVRNRLGR
jgi:HD superfamily phosphohydrolase